MHTRFVMGIKRIATWIAGLSVCLMCAVIFAEIVLRSLFGASLRVSEELASYCLGYAILWGAVISIDSDKFIKIDILYGHFPPSLRKWVDICNDLLLLAFVALTSHYFTLSMVSALQMNTLTNTYFRWPIFYVKLPMLLGLYFLVLYLACRLVFGLREKPASQPGTAAGGGGTR